MTTHPFDLTGRLALVTGARRGIGFAMAESLAAAGADIIGASASMESGESEIRSVVNGLGRSFEAVGIDFADRTAVTEFARTIAARDRPVDILVNNAGTIRRRPAIQHSDEDWDHVLEVNLSAPFVLTREIGHRMLREGYGRVIFTASLLSFQGGLYVPGYAAAKSGIAGLTKSFANEWAGQGVNVNAIAPGYIGTDNTRALVDDTERSASILARIPAGRWGTPEDLGGTAVFLASSAADYIHGVVVPVDGGWMGR